MRMATTSLGVSAAWDRARAEASRGMRSRGRNFMKRQESRECNLRAGKLLKESSDARKNARCSPDSTGETFFPPDETTSLKRSAPRPDAGDHLARSGGTLRVGRTRPVDRRSVLQFRSERLVELEVPAQ